MRLEQGGGQGHQDVWVGVEQRGYGHAADGHALALAILNGFCPLLFKSFAIVTEWGHFMSFQRYLGRAGVGLWQE